MSWINLFAVILVLGYALWITCRGWRLFRNLLHATTVSDVLKNILEQHRFYFVQGVGSFIALVLFLGIKALVLLFTPSKQPCLTPLFLAASRAGFCPANWAAWALRCW